MLGAAAELRSYGIGLMLGLAALGHIAAAGVLMGPFQAVVMGVSLVTVPEAARILRRSPRHLGLFCVLVGAILAVASLAWGATLIVALPRGLGEWLLGPIWRPTYPLVLPTAAAIAAGGVVVGASAGLRALGASRRSVRAQVITSVLYLVAGLAGAYYRGTIGTVQGTAVALWVGVLMDWRQLLAAMRVIRQGSSPRWSSTRQARKGVKGVAGRLRRAHSRGGLAPVPLL